MWFIRNLKLISPSVYRINVLVCLALNDKPINKREFSSYVLLQVVTIIKIAQLCCLRTTVETEW